MLALQIILLNAILKLSLLTLSSRLSICSALMQNNDCYIPGTTHVRYVWSTTAYLRSGCLYRKWLQVRDNSCSMVFKN